jgi:hypothetical protein
LQVNIADLAITVLYLSPQANNNQTAYNIVASFSGDSASMATASMTTLNGTTYDVCTTTQYNSYEPSSNSTAITVMPQTTIGATTLMNPAQMRADAETKGLQVWGPDSFSIFPPFFKLHARVAMKSLGMTTHIWGGLLACGVDNFTGLGTLLLEAPLARQNHLASFDSRSIFVQRALQKSSFDQHGQSHLST